MDLFFHAERVDVLRDVNPFFVNLPAFDTQQVIIYFSICKESRNTFFMFLLSFFFLYYAVFKS